MEVIRAMAATRATCLLQPIVIADEIAQVGLEPTASLVLSQGGLPVAYRAMLFYVDYPEQDSNLQTLGFKPGRSAVGAPGRERLEA